MLLGFCQVDYLDVAYGTSTLGEDGSFCCSMATILAFFGYDTDPVEIAGLVEQDYWDDTKGTTPRAVDAVSKICPDIEFERYTYGSTGNLKNAVFILMDTEGTKYRYYVLRCMQSIALLYDSKSGANYFLNRYEVIRVMLKAVGVWLVYEI